MNGTFESYASFLLTNSRYLAPSLAPPLAPHSSLLRSLATSTALPRSLARSLPWSLPPPSVPPFLPTSASPSLPLGPSLRPFRIREGGQRKAVPGGQCEFRVGAIGLHGMSSVLKRLMHSILGRPELSFDATGRAPPVARTPDSADTAPPHVGPLRAGVLRRHAHLHQDKRGASGARAPSQTRDTRPGSPPARPDKKLSTSANGKKQEPQLPSGFSSLSPKF